MSLCAFLTSRFFLSILVVTFVLTGAIVCTILMTARDNGFGRIGGIPVPSQFYIHTTFSSRTSYAALIYFAVTSNTGSPDVNGYIYMEQKIFHLTDNEQTTMTNRNLTHLYIHYLDFIYDTSSYPSGGWLKYDDRGVLYDTMNKEFKQQFISLLQNIK